MLRKFFFWLEREYHGIGVIVFSLLVAFFALSYSSVALNFLFSVGWVSISPDVPRHPGIEMLRLSFPFRLFTGALLEEILFRYLPFQMAVYRSEEFDIENYWKVKASVIIYATCWSSVVFGLMHGNFFNIFIQGVVGIFFCLVFLKCGGMKRNFGKAVIASAFCHFSYNGLIALIALSSGETLF